MSLSQPGLGETVVGGNNPDKPGVNEGTSKGPSGDGRGRRHAKFQGEGLRVTLRAIKGLTDKKQLRHVFRFQVPPLDEFGWEEGYTWNDYESIEGGTFSRPGGRGLRTVSFNTLFLDYDARWTVVHEPGRQNILSMTKTLRELKNTGTPFLFTAANPKLWRNRNHIQMAATLRGMRVVERGGEPDSFYVGLDFVEYRDQRLTRKRKGKGSGRGQKGGDPNTYIIRRDDSNTLKDLAKSFYGSPSEWRAIYNANPAVKRRGFPPDREVKSLRLDPPHLKSLVIPGFMAERGDG